MDQFSQRADEWVKQNGIDAAVAAIKGNEASILKHIKHAYAEGLADARYSPDPARRVPKAA